MEIEIQSLLEKLLDINDSMSRCAASSAPTTSVTQKLAIHRDILHEFMQASGSVSPRMQLLRERAAIHGSISNGSLGKCFVAFGTEWSLLSKCFWSKISLLKTCHPQSSSSPKWDLDYSQERFGWINKSEFKKNEIFSTLLSDQPKATKNEEATAAA